MIDENDSYLPHLNCSKKCFDLKPIGRYFAEVIEVKVCGQVKNLELEPEKTLFFMFFSNFFLEYKSLTMNLMIELMMQPNSGF